MNYKKSIFNYIFDKGNELRLYNSLKGSQSLLLVKGNKYGEAKKILESEIYNKDTNSSIFTGLMQLGYLIPENINENILRERNLNDVVNYSKLHLIIMPTEDCNFRCTYCYETHEKGLMTMETQEALIKFVSENIKYYTGLNVGWFGGEPLEALDIIRFLSEKFIKICNIARKPYKAGMTTNAFNLTADIFKELSKLHVYEYQISIDGLKEEHDKLRKLKDGSGSFDRIISNIKAIKQIKEIAAEIVIRTNFTKSIINKLEEYIKFYNNLLMGDNRFSIQINMASDWGGNEVKNIANDLLNLNDYLNLFSSINAVKNNINFSYHLQELNPAEFKCYAGKRNSYCIGSDAKIYKCTESFDLPENNIGKLLMNGEMKIDRYLESLWINTASISFTLKCKKCSYSGCCLYSPCPRNTLTSKDKVPVCPRTKGNIENILELIDDSLYKILE